METEMNEMNYTSYTNVTFLKNFMYAGIHQLSQPRCILLFFVPVQLTVNTVNSTVVCWLHLLVVFVNKDINMIISFITIIKCSHVTECLTRTLASVINQLFINLNCLLD